MARIITAGGADRIAITIDTTTAATPTTATLTTTAQVMRTATATIRTIGSPGSANGDGPDDGAISFLHTILSERNFVTGNSAARRRASFLGRLDVPEREQESDIVDDLQHAAGQERQAGKRGGEQRARQRRTERRGEAARHRRDAGGRGALGRRDDRHHVGSAGRHVQLGERRT